MLTRRALVTGVAGSVRRGRRPNLLFLIADDHAGYVLGANGDRQARTPHLDQLAAEGVNFTNHFCNQPVCTPSRQSLLTGEMPSAAGVTVLQTPLSEEKYTLAKHLAQAGYRTAVFGKMHFNRASRAGLHGFAHASCEDVIQREWRALAPRRVVEATVRVKPAWRPFRDPARIWLNADKLPYPRYEEDMRSAHTVRQACAYLDEHRTQPFALWVSLQEPHSPFDFPVEDSERFRREDFAPPPVGPEDGWQIPLIFRDLSAEEKAGIRAAYYTSVEYLDRNMGRVLGHLRKLGLEDNTVVVYTADHGYCLGHHGRFEKHCGYDPALRVPLIVRAPGRMAAGRRVTALTEHIDVAPTLCELLDLDPMPGQHGQTLAGKRARRRDHVVAQYLENEEAFVRTERWKYIYGTGERKRQDGYETENPTPGPYERLFDLRSDAGEFVNVAGRHPELARRMQDLWLARMRATHPEREREPAGGRAEVMRFYLRPRDAKA
jgi:choline-sulfatase